VREVESPWLVSETSLDLSDMIIGQGRSGNQVRVAIWIQLEVAVKQLNWDQAMTGGVKQLEELHQQLNLSHSMRHPNVVALLGAVLSMSNPPWLLYELLPQNLEETIRIHRKDGEMALNTITCIALDIARGLHYLHHCGVAHGNLNSRKVMITSSNRAKLLYTPGQGSRGGGLGPDGDLYEFGLLLCEMATGQVPDPNDLELCYQDLTSPRLREVIRRCLDATVEERPTTDELISMLKLLRN